MLLNRFFLVSRERAAPSKKKRRLPPTYGCGIPRPLLVHRVSRPPSFFFRENVAGLVGHKELFSNILDIVGTPFVCVRYIPTGRRSH